MICGWGLRRTETSRLDLADWGRNPAAAEFGRYGMLHVRYGKAVRGQPPRRRNVASVMGWAVEAVADYVSNIRPRFGAIDQPALWVTERGGRIKPAEINARFVAYRDALGLPREPSYSLRHSYVTHQFRGRRGPPVHPTAGRAPLRHLDGHLHELSGIASDARSSRVLPDARAA